MVAEIFPFRPRPRPASPREVEASVTNLWVKRQELRREADENQLIWLCTCGSRVFNWYRVHGLRCEYCGKKTVPPR